MGFDRHDRADLAVIGLWVWALFALGPVVHLGLAAPGHSHAHHHSPAEETAPHPEAPLHAHGAFDTAHAGVVALAAKSPVLRVAAELSLPVDPANRPDAPALVRRWSPLQPMGP